ncbi:MAG: CysS/YqeB C-terminal domain-containing protein, partial [Minisyncoccia bacterium]
YIFADLLARMFATSGYHVRRVINITDVGHLVGDADAGQDKMDLAAKREHKSPEEIAAHYTKLFLDDLETLSIDTEAISFPRATEYIAEQIAMAKTLEEKGFAYRLPDGLYFDTSKFARYGALGNIGHAELKSVARVTPAAGKRHSSDFALWRTAKPGDLQQWPSPWGSGNPGWHIECSAMIRALLGPTIDIHTGGEDHIAIHHNNEIAQSECANDRPLAHYWMHAAFLTMEGDRIAKSVGNIVYLSELVEHGFDPLALRYFFLQAHYRTPLSFSWDALSAAAEALLRLRRVAREFKEESEGKAVPSPARERFAIPLRDDLGTPAALGILWESLKSEEYTPEEKWGLILDADHFLGLELAQDPGEEPEAPAEVKELLARREAARGVKNFDKADQLREEIEMRGYSVEDGAKGPVLTKRPR